MEDRMPAKSRAKAKKPRQLSFKDLDYRIPTPSGKFRCSSDIAPCKDIIGQHKAMDAIRMGLDIQSVGYNVFVTGHAGTGRTTTIKHILEQLEQREPVLHDICYVNNFKNEECPQILVFEAGDGRRFKKDMGYLIGSLRKGIPKIFLSSDYKERQGRIIAEFEGRQKKLIGEFEEKLTAGGFVMVQIQSGAGVRNEIQPLIDEEPASIDKLERLAKEGKFPLARLDEMRRTGSSLRREFDSTTIESKKLAEKLEEALNRLDYTLIAPLITDKISLLMKRYASETVVAYLTDVEVALVSDLDRFRESQPRRGEEEAPPYRKREPFEEFSVNLILDNAETDKVPIIIETSPTYKNLFGSLERVVDRFGYWRTDFTRIFGGSLLQASGGFLVINVTDLLTEPGVWTHLKRALRNQEIEITGYDPFYMMAGSGIKPEPIPINLKVVMIGDAHIYRQFWQLDEDFKKVFKVKAEFDNVMPLNKKNVRQYFEFVSKVVTNEQLLPFDESGMQAVCEYALRLSGQRDRLSTRFTAISDMIREASYCASQRKSKNVTREDMHCAVIGKRSRVNLVEEKMQEMYDTDILMISTRGRTVGQINGLSVFNVGEYQFGRPTRITVNTSLGKRGVINIEREADLSGPIHNKGVLVLSGYLREVFAQDKPLAMSASISFEQSYSGVDGDSASSTEIYAILSSIAQIPLKQSLAVTGSMNQKGQIQPIGGVNEKIEGFFDVCKAKKLTGDQGVIIPHQNVKDLVLRPDVMDAVKEGKFHIYPIKTIAEGIEILTDLPAGKRNASGKYPKGTVIGMVDDKLREMAMTLQNFGRDRGNNDNDQR